MLWLAGTQEDMVKYYKRLCKDEKDEKLKEQYEKKAHEEYKAYVSHMLEHGMKVKNEKDI